MRMVDRDWTVEECLQVMEDLDYIEKYGYYREIPEWAKQVAEELHTFTGGAGVLRTAYEKSAKAFRKHLIEGWRRDRDYVPCPGDRPLEK